MEDCELSFRHLFAGYRTKFVKEIVAPAELPATYTAYKAQQKRWTQGWVQLQRLHLRTLLFGYRCSPVRRLAFAYHMCISWQWPAWALWLTMLPLLIFTDLWFGALGPGVGLALYLLPTVLWLFVSTTVASLETKHTYRERLTLATFRRRVARIAPYVVINTGMLPHQFSAFAEGLFGTMHSEFERTPKAASVTGAARASSAATTSRSIGPTCLPRPSSSPTSSPGPWCSSPRPPARRGRHALCRRLRRLSGLLLRRPWGQGLLRHRA